MKFLKITLLVIAGLGLIASVYNAIHQQSIYELLGIFPSVLLVLIYFKVSNNHGEVEEQNS